MITDHDFRSRPLEGIDPPADARCATCDAPRSEHEHGCRGVLTIRGEHFWCDLVAPHDGWGHMNKAAEAIWDGPQRMPQAGVLVIPDELTEGLPPAVDLDQFRTPIGSVMPRVVKRSVWLAEGGTL